MNVIKLREKCKKYKLEAPEAFWECPEFELSLIYNGAGPDWMPEWGRFVLTFFLRIFAPAFLIHDFEYYKSNKSKNGFRAANQRMWRNMNKINRYLFGAWYWRPVYRYWQLKALAAYEAVKEFGWSAWLD